MKIINNVNEERKQERERERERERNGRFVTNKVEFDPPCEEEVAWG